MKQSVITYIFLSVIVAALGRCYADDTEEVNDPWVGCHRPVDTNAFNTTKGNNHDSVIFVEPELEYPYHMIISHTDKAAHLWRARKFSWDSANRELVSDQYLDQH